MNNSYEIFKIIEIRKKLIYHNIKCFKHEVRFESLS